MSKGNVIDAEERVKTDVEGEQKEPYKPKRRRQRQCLVELLYMVEMQRDVPIEQLLEFYGQEQKEIGGAAEDVWNSDFVKQTLQGIVTHLSVLDEELKTYVKNWSFDRIAKMDLAILRLALYELMFSQGTPAPVVINEAIELSKTYSSNDSKRFVNGILDQVAKGKGA